MPFQRAIFKVCCAGQGVMEGRYGELCSLLLSPVIIFADNEVVLIVLPFSHLLFDFGSLATC